MSDSGQQAKGLVTFLQLERSARKATTLQRLQFVIANETFRLFHFRQAAVWSWRENEKPRVVTLSGIAQIDVNAPYVHWLGDLLAAHAPRDEQPLRVLDGQDLDARWQQGWGEYIKGHMLLCPLRSNTGDALGGLVMVRDEPWNEEETQLVDMLGEAYGHAWSGLLPHNRRWRMRRLLHSLRSRPVWKISALLLALAAFIPVRLSALAPASIIPIAPIAITSPLDGAIAHIDVAPNASVVKDDILFRIDDTHLRNQLAIAEKAFSVAEAEHLRAVQKAFGDIESKEQIALLEARMEQKRSEIDYYRELLGKTQVRSPQDGVAVFSDPNAWIGKPVVVGEKIMDTADPGQVQIEMWLPVSDAINLLPGSEVILFLNTDPSQPVRGTLTQTSYQAELNHSGVLAFRLLARVDGSDRPPRLGLHGTAKLYGEQVALIYYLLRRPAASLRQWIGL
jgi:hypothetical protein